MGGGSDIENFFRSHEGAVVSCAISKYVFVHAKIHDDSFGERYRISYSQVEHVQEISQIKNAIVRAALEFLEIDFPIQISTLADLPAGTGLGSSSSFTVALLLALHELKGRRPTKHELAEEACHIEVNLLKHPIGKQDQYAAAFGGLNLLKFRQDSRVSVEPICISSKDLLELSERTRLYWTNTKRSASRILKDQEGRSSENSDALRELALLAHKFRDALENESIDWGVMANIISKSWSIKQNLSPLISSNEIAEFIRKLQVSEKQGIKLLGAGGGGFILNFDGNENYPSPYEQFVDAPLSSFTPEIDHLGARIISSF